MKHKISRSTFLLGVAGSVAALATHRLTASAQEGPRNVLWIVDDDHPPYMMEPMPVTRWRIRDAGTNYFRGHTDIPLCGPARVSLLTGLSVTTHGCDTNRTYRNFAASPLALEERIVARYMRDAGYTTAHFGKYINGHAAGGTGDVPPHWDRWCETQGDGSDSGGNATSPNQGNVDGEWIDIPEGVLPSIWAAKECVSWIRNRSGQPWFAQYCPTIPHQPYTPTPRSEHLYAGAARTVPSANEQDMFDKLRWMRTLPPRNPSNLQQEYRGKKEELADLDYYGMRPILTALTQTGQLGNTVIFFTSDNGYLHGEHLLRRKDHPYWESAQVPFFARGPGVSRGARRSTLVNHTDLMPTTCEIAGISPATLEVDGRSLVPHLDTSDYSGWRKRMLITGSDDVGPELNPGGADYPSGRWWLLREGVKAFILHENGAKELYWMATDPYQNRNKARQTDPALLERLTTTVETMKTATGEMRRRLEEAP